MTNLIPLNVLRTFDIVKHITGTFYVFCLPFLMPYIMYKNSILYNFYDLIFLFIFGYFKIFLTFTILHRFFSHKSFLTNRFFSFVLSIIASTSAQKGPLWWSSKHIRHHKFCENEGDPHSIYREGFWYAWLGWVLLLKEMYVDWSYVLPHFKTLEMLIAECLAGTVPFLELYLYYKLINFKYCTLVYWATVVTVLITLSFNVFLHHDGMGKDNKQVNGRYLCRAHNKCPLWIRLTIDFIGEMDHYDHHLHPRKALHPSYFVDLPYWCFIYPGLQLGIFSLPPTQ